ncbi:MAG: saccharopine dehydrogenase NADP-binding domain-containing protein [Thermoleophilaceae bacterium]|nr:saccharopine dehydrogenase NADP-binding domain-containing protein [Thermoleophilaceae bacterium]
MNERDLDIVLYGATGFVGELTAEYLAANSPDSLRWALAGRNPEKLTALRSKLAKANPALADLPLIAADAADATSLEEMARSTRILISTVGPYALYGEPLVKACAENGTHYLDLTGEPGFVDEMYLKYDATAKSTGAKLVHCCGFDSIPHDLGAYFTVLQLPENVPITVESRVRASGMISGGTFYSALNGMGHAKQTVDAVRERLKREPRPEGRKVGLVKPGLRRDKEMGMWTAPLPTIDQFIATRSASTIDRYGPDFKYGHNYAAKHLPTVFLGTAGVASVFVMAQIPPIRKGLLKLIPPGSGPSAEKRAKSWFRVEFVGNGGGKTVRTAVSGGDAGYEETSKMLAESGLALALDVTPERSGQLTPVAAMGDALLERLPKAGIKIEVVERS